MLTPLSTRRHFLKVSGISAAVVPFIGLSALPLQSGCTPSNLSIQEVIDKIIAQIPGGKKEQTVDTVKSGTPTDPVTGIVTTFLATVDVIRQAAEKGANLIITHEPTFYNHHDETDWLADDPVYTYKRSLLDEHGIVVWRFHDYWHLHQPDGILHGLLQDLDWQDYLDPNRKSVCVIPPTNLRSLATFFKDRLMLKRTFFIGDPALACTKIGLHPGAMGRDNHVRFLREDIEVLVIGEINEWETVEYVRDAVAAGMNKGLIILGHAMSEEPGMRYAQEWLSQLVPAVPSYHVPALDPFSPV
ncbi:MAG: Nif3-like dinuclear metal center hexameric protein [Bacteroidota bacterium]